MMVCTKVSCWEEVLTGVQRGMLIRVYSRESSTKASFKAWTPFACRWKGMEWTTSEDAWRAETCIMCLVWKGRKRGKKEMEDREVKRSERKEGDLDKKQDRRQGKHSQRRAVVRDWTTSFMIKRPLVGLSFLIKVSKLKLRIHDEKRVGRSGERV